MIKIVPPTEPGSSEAHENLIKDILATFSSGPNLRLWKNSTGSGKVNNRFLRWGLKGSADIIGVGLGGRFIGIEVKTGQSPQKEQQRNFQNMVIAMGGIYIVARSIDDVRNMINKNS